MSKRLTFPLFSVAFDLILFKLACNEDIHNSLVEFNFQPLTVELAALEHLKVPIDFRSAIVALWDSTCFKSF